MQAKASRLGLNVHVYPNAFEYESRILKVTKVLINRGFVERVLVIAMAKIGLPPKQSIDGSREVLRVKTRINGDGLWHKILCFVEWSIRVVVQLRHKAVGMVNCHSLSVLPLCVVLKWWHKCILVYEPHELETETATSIGIRKQIAKVIESRLIGQADLIIVVSKSIAKQYQSDYRLSDVSVILNVPDAQKEKTTKPNNIIRNRFMIPDNHMVFIYEGMFEESRGLGWLLNAFRQVSPDRHLVLMGFGPMEEEVRIAASSVNNIHIHPPVAPSDIIKYTQGADIGFALLTDDCLNHQCALPNKLFAYLHSGLPVIVSDLAEMSALVDRYQCGWRVSNESLSIATCVLSIDEQAIKVRRDGTQSAIRDLNWGCESEKLASIYHDFLERRDLH
jgi:glycosyltransferase involved in cell wall biosynthesis